MIGKTIVSVSKMRDPEFDDEGYLKITFSDGTHCWIIASYKPVFTSCSKGEYPTDISISEPFTVTETVWEMGEKGPNDD